MKWFRDNGIPLYGVNENPTQHLWTKSPKPYCNVYIDDAALGCPLTYDSALSKRPFVDWQKVMRMIGDIKEFPLEAVKDVNADIQGEQKG